MLRQSIKDVYFLWNQYLCLPNTAIARLRFRNPKHAEGHYIHLGCGDDYIEGMVNVDGNWRRRSDLWLDLRNKLPFADKSVAVLYCSHTIEHLYPEQSMALLKEMRRILSPCGIIRIAVPSFEHAMRIVAGDMTSAWPREFESSDSQAINYLFCDGQHRYAFCFATLERFAKEAGFPTVVNVSRDHGVTKQRYGRLWLGGEPRGSLVVELLNCDDRGATLAGATDEALDKPLSIA